MNSDLLIPPPPKWFAEHAEHSIESGDADSAEDLLCADDGLSESEPSCCAVEFLEPPAVERDAAGSDVDAAWRESGSALPVSLVAAEAESAAVEEELEPIFEFDEVPEPASLLDVSSLRSGVIAGLLSAAVHLWLFLTLDGLPYANWRPSVSAVEPYEVDTELKPEPLEEVEEEEIVAVELANPGEREMEVRPVMNAMSVGRQKSDVPVIESAPQFNRDIEATRASAPVYDVPQGLEVDDQLVVRGTTGENLIQIESAIDRITWEVAQNLKEQKVLLIWMLDASGSLAPQRAVIERRLNRVYSELNALENSDQLPRHDQPLLTGVAAYGLNHQYLTKEPTYDVEAVREAFRSIKTDESGVENVFTAVGAVVKNWSRYRTLHGRRIMVVVVTDETGDDFGPPLEQSIATCRRYGAKAYVVGPSAVFGRRKGFVSYVAPENNKTYDLPVDLGPETAMMENIRLPFWYKGPQYNYLSSGFGPYGLSRLVSETGGVYFMTNMTTTETLTPFGAFDTGTMKAFVPDYRFGSPQEFEADLKKHPLRAAVVTAALLSEQYQPEGTPELDLRVTPANFRQTATKAQETAAKSQLALDMILQAFPPGIEKQLDKEPSPRWRMAFCLTYGRLLAQKTRSLEYNSALAAMKSNLTPEDVGSRSNHWIFRPDREINYAPSMKRSAKVAEELLRRVLDEAPGTPWATLAARELQDPFGIRVVERFIPPPPPAPPAPQQPARRTVQLAPEPRNNPPAPRPAPPVQPKLPKL